MIDLGAGMGKLTRVLAGRYARVIAVEPLDGMRAILGRVVPGVEALPGSAERIGYALLRTYKLTHDEVWLERARSFAVDALGRLQNRYSLFTGDIGAALYLQSCLEVDARFPILDVL